MAHNKSYNINQWCSCRVSTESCAIAKTFDVINNQPGQGYPLPLFDEFCYFCLDILSFEVWHLALNLQIDCEHRVSWSVKLS